MPSRGGGPRAEVAGTALREREAGRRIDAARGGREALLACPRVLAPIGRSLSAARSRSAAGRWSMPSCRRRASSSSVTGPRPRRNHIAERAGVGVGSLDRFFPTSRASSTRWPSATSRSSTKRSASGEQELSRLRALGRAPRRAAPVRRRARAPARRRRAEPHAHGRAGFPALTAFETRVEKAAVAFLRGRGDAGSLRGASGAIVGPIVARAACGTMRSTLARTPDLSRRAASPRS